MSIIRANAKFTANNVPVLAQLSNGRTEKVVTYLQAEGTYSHWLEQITDYTSDIMEEQEIDEETIEPLYKDEFEYVDEIKEQYNKECADNSIVIEKIIEVLDKYVDWQVDESTIEGNEPDED